MLGCTANLPNVEIDLTLKGAPTIEVAPCHPGEAYADCYLNHHQTAYPPVDPNMAKDNIGIYDVPSSVSDLTLVVQQDDPKITFDQMVGPVRPCNMIVVHLKHGDEKLALTAGDSFVLSCPAGSDCEMPTKCQ